MTENLHVLEVQTAVKNLQQLAAYRETCMGECMRRKLVSFT